ELSGDQLREKSSALRKSIIDSLQPFKDKIADFKQKADHNPDMDVNEKEDLYKQIDEVEKEIDVEVEKVLDERLPEAFAIVKETARRFKESEEIEVTANDFDRTLSADHNNVEIRGSHAIYKNKWLAAGSEITWD